MYELTFLLQDEKDLKVVNELLASCSGKILEEQNWGKRDLSYEINKLNSSNFYTWKIEIERKNLQELKKKLNFNDKLIRYLILKC